VFSHIEQEFQGLDALSVSGVVLSPSPASTGPSTPFSPPSLSPFSSQRVGTALTMRDASKVRVVIGHGDKPWVS
jgi:hypothetical protein